MSRPPCGPPASTAIPAAPQPDAQAPQDVWAHQARISRQLAAWSAVSIAGGSVLLAVGRMRDRPALRAFGVQSAAWGVVDLAISGVGELRRRRRLATLPDPSAPSVQASEGRSLRRILLVNAALDVGYVTAGLAGLAWSLRRRPDPSATIAGHGAAVVVQGGFLLAFDLGHARR